MDTPTRLFGRQRPLYDVLGRGKVANILLWRDPRVSASILAGNVAIWFLFQVVDYNLVTLLCHIFITTMLTIFIWSTIAEFFNLNPPNIPKIILQDSTFRDAASILHKKFNYAMSLIMYIACGNDLKLFLLTIVSLWMISVIGSAISTLNLLFLGVLCLEILPVMYEHNEDEVDYLAYVMKRRMQEMYKKFEAEFLGKIPRKHVKGK